MTKSEEIQESCQELAKAHWEFLEQFLEDMGATTVMNIADVKYGFLLAFPHGYKHGIENKECEVCNK